MDDAVFDGSALAPEARGLEDFEHPPVVDERVGTEAGDALGRRVGREVLEEQRGQPAALVLVGDRERDFGLVTVGESIVATDGDHLLAQERDERHAVVVVDGREMRDLAIGQVRPRTEEAEVHALLGLAREECTMRARVIWPDGSYVHGATIREDRVDRPGRWVSVWSRVAHSGTVTVMVVPDPGFDSISNCPPIASARSTRFPIPIPRGAESASKPRPSSSIWMTADAASRRIETRQVVAPE